MSLSITRYTKCTNCKSLLVKAALHIFLTKSSLWFLHIYRDCNVSTYRSCNVLYIAHSAKTIPCLSMQTLLALKLHHVSTGRFSAAWGTATLPSRERCLPTLLHECKSSSYPGIRKYNFMFRALRQACQHVALRQRLIPSLWQNSKNFPAFSIRQI